MITVACLAATLTIVTVAAVRAEDDVLDCTFESHSSSEDRSVMTMPVCGP